MIYQIRANVYCKDKADAEAIFKAVSDLKDKVESFTNAGSHIETSKIDLIENNHDGACYLPCVMLKEHSLDLEGKWTDNVTKELV